MKFPVILFILKDINSQLLSGGEVRKHFSSTLSKLVLCQLNTFKQMKSKKMKSKKMKVELNNLLCETMST